jgi:polyhydroxyalkanoate synthesis regulator phasin
VNYLEAKLRLEKSAALRLLKAESAALCIAFLRDVFRVDRAISRPQHEMISRLTTVLDEINAAEEPKRFPRSAKDYIDKWVADGALVTRYGDGDEILYELTPEADHAILFFRQIGEQVQGTRGAQSKLRTIMESLQRIHSRANPDRDERIKELQAQIDALVDERTRLAAGEELEPDSPEKLMEEYLFAVEMAQGLLSDFSMIRLRFLQVAQELAERYASADTTRGALLERAITAHKELQTNPLGQSFAGFRDYLAADETQSKLLRLIERIEEIPALKDTLFRDRFLARMPSSLIDEAKAVIAQTRRLSSDLRRMLDASAITSRKEVHEMLGSVKSLAYSLADDPPVADLMVVALPYTDSALAEQAIRQTWRPPDTITPAGEFRAHPNDGQEQALKLLSALSAVDIPRLLNLLQTHFEQEDHGFRMTEMLNWHPPRPGEWLLDVVGYLEIARNPKGKHVIKNEPDQRWSYRPPGSTRTYMLPQVYFFK